MKFKLLVLMALICARQVYSAPVVNENVSDNHLVTAYRDHQDPNVIYFAPNVMTLSLTEEGKPIFSYIEYRKGLSKKALIQSSLSARFMEDEISQMKEKFIKTNKNVRFTSIPFLNSSIKFGDILRPFVESSLCDHAGGPIESEQVCSFRLTQKGRKIFRNNIKSGLIITVNYEYNFQGVLNNADGSFKDALITHNIAGRIGGEILSQYPELFIDSRGRILQ